MNRRAFLRFLGLAPVVGPAVVQAMAMAPAPVQLAGRMLPGTVLGLDHRAAAKAALKVWLAEEIDRDMLEALRA